MAAAQITHTISNLALSNLVQHMCSPERGDSVIHAIKLVREVTGVGLKEANDFVRAIRKMKRKCHTPKNQEKLIKLLGLKENEFTSTELLGEEPIETEESNSEVAQNLPSRGSELLEFYTNFMKTHTYREWDEFLRGLVQGEVKS
jgi:hypothetical protein